MAIVQSDIVLADGDKLTIGSEETINGIMVNAGGVLTVSGGGMATGTTVNNSGIVFVYKDGIANKTTLNSGGSMFVNSAGTASVATVNADGRLEVSSGGTASGIEVVDGGSLCFAVAPDTYVQGTQGGSSFEMADGVIAGYTVLNGRLQVSGGGIMNDAVVDSSGVVWVSSGGSVNGATIKNGGAVTVSGGGTATGAAVNEKGSIRLYGGTADNAEVNESGGILVYTDGVANNTVLNAGGSMYVNSAGSALGATVNTGGRLEVSSGGTASGIEVLEGGSLSFAVAPDTYVQGTRGGSSFEMAEGLIAGYTVLNGRLQVSGGGIMNDTVVDSGGAVWVSSGGSVNGATLNGSGQITVSGGGTVGDVVVHSGGYFQVSSGATITGKTTLESGALIAVKDGAVFDFDISELAPGAEARINNLSLVKASPTFTLTVSDSQGAGKYTLAEGAADFTGSITVHNTAGEDLGTLNVGEMLYIGENAYRLNLADDALTLSIIPPTITDSNGDVRLANAMPEARYMYGCAPTATAMLLGYYDLYGYRGNDFSALIDGDVDLKSRGSEDVKYTMNDFDSVLGRATATMDYVERFYSKDSLDLILSFESTETTPAEELEYSFVEVDGETVLRTDIWNCLADYLGTGQFWRTNGNLNTTSLFLTLEQSLLDDESHMVTDEETGIQRTIMTKDVDLQCGLYRYVQDRGYSLDMKVTGGHQVDAVGGSYTFEDYMEEIDAGRPVLVIIDGHIMTGYGYNAETKEIIFDDCYEADRRMVWDGTYHYARADRKLNSIVTVGMMTADCDNDLALSVFDESSESPDKLILSTTEKEYVSQDYCFFGSPLYASYAVANLGSTESGAFDVYIFVDGETKEWLPTLSLDPGTVRRVYDVPLVGELGVGLHAIAIAIDPDNKIQETSGLNNIEKRSLMVLKEGTNIVEGMKTVDSGEISADDYVMNGAGIQVLEGGIAEGTVIQGKVLEKSLLGEVATFSPGIVNVSGGGLIRNADVYEYGQLQLSGAAEDIRVQADGNVVVFDGGCISGVFVDKDGKLALEAGGMLTGQIEMESDATVSFEEGAILNFDLAQAAGADALVNDLSVIQGTPLYTLTVDGTEENGKYTLAAGAADFTGSITVRNTSGETLGTLTVGETATISEVDYSLNLSDDVLSLQITGGAPSEIISGLVLTDETRTVSAGEQYIDTTVSSGGKLIVDPDGTADTTLVDSDGNMLVHGGGSADNTTVKYGGSMSVSGGTATNTTVHLGFMYVSGGGSADNTTIRGEAFHAGALYVMDGGKADNTTVVNGWMDVSSGGTATSTTVDSFGSMFVYTDGTANSTTVVGALHVGYSDGAAFLCSGGTVNDAVVSQKGSMYVDFGGTANRTTVNNSAMLALRNGTVNGVTVNNSGAFFVGKGGTASNVTMNGGGIGVESGVVDTLFINSGAGAILSGTNQSVSQDTVVLNNVHIMSGGWIRFYYNGERTVKAFGDSAFLNGVTLNGVSLVSGLSYTGKLNLQEGNRAEDVTVRGTVPAGQTSVGPAAAISMSYLNLSSGATAARTTLDWGGALNISNGAVADSVTVNARGKVTVSGGGIATGIIENGGVVDFEDGAQVIFASNTFSGLVLSGGSATVHSGTTATDTAVENARMHIFEGGVANNIAANNGGDLNVSSGGYAKGVTVSGGKLLVSKGGVVKDAVTNQGWIHIQGGTVGNATVNANGKLDVSSDGKLTGKITVESGAEVSVLNGTLDFDLTQTAAGAETLVNNLSIIDVQGAQSRFTLTVDGTEENGMYTLAAGAADFTGSITVQNTSGESFGTLTVGEKVSVGDKDYLLSNEDSALTVTVSDQDVTPAKWTYLVYMAADSNICFCALYDIISIQQANIDPEIEVYVLADRCAADDPLNGDYETLNGTYKWDSLWDDTRVGKITCSPDLTVTVDWESWGELDTGSIGTLERFVDWAQEKSPAENYGLILWDHGGESAELCWDLTTDPNWQANLTISEVSDLLKEKGNIPLVVFNNCLLCSELVVTQMAGSTDVIVASEPTSYGMSTYNYNVFFNTITPDMTAQEMAAIMVQNVEAQNEVPGEATMLTAVDVSDPGLGDALEAFAEAIFEAENDTDITVLTHAMLKAPQDGCLYDGSVVQQSDLGFLIRDVMSDRDYEGTSDGFKKALADVKTALDAIVLEYRSVPSGRGSGIAVCNTVITAQKSVGSGNSTEKADAAIKKHITSYYKSNPQWGGLLYVLGALYLEESADKLSPPPVFTVCDVEGLVEGQTVSVSDFGCFSGVGELFDGINLIGDFFFSFVVTAEDKSTGRFFVSNGDDAEVTVSLLSSNGTEVATGTNTVAFENLAAGEYYVRLQSETDCRVTVTSFAEFKTGVDRFDYAGSGKNEEYANGNGSIDTATPLDEGYYSGLITYQGDTDYYRIGNIHTERYEIQVTGEDGWTVAEYDKDGTLIQSAEFSNGKYTLTMNSQNYLLVEGISNLEEGLNPYSFNVVGLENGSGDNDLDELAGTKEEVSWKSSTIVEQYILELSKDNFEHVLQIGTIGTAVDMLGLPAGTYQWRVKADSENDDNPWYVGESFVSDNTNDKPRVFQSKVDASDDMFFASPNGIWSSGYAAKHVGTCDDWTGTGELVFAAGKNCIQDLFFGSADPGALYLTDSGNGDALFLDDVYTVLPEEVEENTARLFRLRYINAGAGDDIIDMTSRQFEYAGSKLTICGGDGNDVIWAYNGRNSLYGDAGNDRIVGASGNDVIVGGIGNDSMHGGGGDDVFTFCENWGVDTVEQLETGTVTLWFISGDESNWNAETLTYTDGGNSVTVSGVSADQITLKFGAEQTEVFSELYNSGAFEEFVTRKIFEESDESDKGILASV